MSMTKIEASGVPFIPDGPNSGTRQSATISEAQAIAFLRDRALEVKEKFGADKYATACIEVGLYAPGTSSPVVTRVSIGSGAMEVHCSGSTFAEAWENAADKSPVERAKFLREKAAQILALAETLSPVVKK